jgi:hypothetical protein
MNDLKKEDFQKVKIACSRNRQDVRLYHTRILPPFTPESWAEQSCKIK